MRRSTQNLVNEGSAAKIFWTKDLRLTGGAAVFPVLGIGSYCLWLITIRHFNIRGVGGAVENLGYEVEGEGDKNILWGLDKVGAEGTFLGARLALSLGRQGRLRVIVGGRLWILSGSCARPAGDDRPRR
jgi:hypothetical protein